MPKFQLMATQDVTAYVSFEIEAATLEDAREEAIKRATATSAEWKVSDGNYVAAAEITVYDDNTGDVI